MSNNNSSGGIGFLSLLGIAFIVLKLCKFIAWSWWWVTCPLWGPLAIYLIVMAAIGLWAIINVRFFSSPGQREQMKRIIEDQKRNGGKSKWQQRMEQMQEAQKLRENK